MTSHPIQKTLPMSAVPKQYLTLQEYLALERRAETNNEYLRGVMFAISGTSREHNSTKAESDISELAGHR